MSKQIWLSLTARERDVLRRAADAYEKAHHSKTLQDAATKLTEATSYPKITVGVYGGVVQWVIGNPFPVRIIDYDGDPKELPDIDEHGHHCTIGFEQPQPAQSSFAS